MTQQMILKINAYQTSTGKACSTLEEAQIEEITTILTGLGGRERSAEGAGNIATLIVEEKERILDILTTTTSSKPRARKINGGRKTRKPNAATVNAALQDGKQ